ncbi:MAG: cohesin domain-containing protein [Candidatus Bathyarchaeia archaeon]
MKLTKTSTFLILLIITSLFVTLIASCNLVKSQESQVTVSVNPTYNTYPPNTEFTVTVNVVNADRIHSYEFYLYWNPAILKCLRATKGTWLSKDGTYTTYFISRTNNTIGRLLVAESIRGEYVQSGNGILATVTFQTLQPGLSALDLNNTKMIKRYLPGEYKEDVYPKQQDGYFQYPTTTLAIEPHEIVQAPGLTFTVNITATNLYNLNRWSINLKWNPEILNMTQAEEAPWNTTSPTTFNYTINNEEGYSTINSTLQTLKGENGSKTLASITFLVLVGGETPINITSAQLLDISGTPHITNIINGLYSITRLSTRPPYIIDKTLRPGNQITLNLTISGAENLNAWAANLTWNPTIVNLTQVTEGPFLKTQGTTTFTSTPLPQIGVVALKGQLPQGIGVNGSGVVAILKFEVVGGGKFKFEIYNSTLLDINGEEIPHITSGTEFDNTAHEAAITEIQTSKQTAKQKETITITLAILNNGTVAENLTITLQLGRVIIATKQMENTPPLTQTTTQTEYTIEDFPPGTYELKAKIQYLPDEENYTNNMKSTTITIEVPPQTAIGWEIITALIIAIAIIAAATFIILKKFRKTSKKTKP